MPKKFSIRIERGNLKNCEISSGFFDVGARITTSLNRGILFNILTNKFYIDFEDLVIADFCAGSGIVGFEMLSLGAKKCYFVENDVKKCKNINLAIEKKQFQCEVLQCFLPKIPTFEEKIDIIFFDPPYENNFCDKTLENLYQQDILTENGMIILESTKKPESEFKIIHQKELKNGATFWFLKK